MFSLFLIANSDGEYHHKENQFFELTATLLGYHLSSNFDAAIDEFTMEEESLFRNLNSLGESQKDWYIVTVLGMIHADGATFEEELHYMEVFLEEMGISVQRFENVIKKTDLLMQKFG